MSPRRPAVLQSGGDQTLRELLVATATRLIAVHGTVGLTVRGVAAEAGVAQGALYNHFDGKEELIALALHEYVQSVMHSVMLPLAGTSTVEANLRVYIDVGMRTLARVLPAFAGIVSEPATMARFAEHFSEDLSGGIPDLFARYLRAEQALGRIAADADIESAATLIVGACHTEALPSLFRGSPQGHLVVRAGFVDGLANTVLYGIAPR